jgi:hypothetical protein
MQSVPWTHLYNPTVISQPTQTLRLQLQPVFHVVDMVIDVQVI